MVNASAQLRETPRGPEGLEESDLELFELAALFKLRVCGRDWQHRKSVV